MHKNLMPFLPHLKDPALREACTIRSMHYTGHYNTVTMYNTVTVSVGICTLTFYPAPW